MWEPRTEAASQTSEGEESASSAQLRPRKKDLGAGERCIGAVLVKAVFKQIVSSELLVLVAGEISLDDEVAVEAHGSEAVDCCSLLRRHADLMAALASLRRSRCSTHRRVQKRLEVGLILRDQLPRIVSTAMATIR